MSHRRMILAILIAFTATTQVRGQWGPSTRIDFAVDKVGVRLAKGDDRQKILEEFNAALGKYAKEDVLQYGKRLSTDLAESIKTAARADEPDPVKRFAETKLPRNLLRFYHVDLKRFRQFATDNPTDPAAQIISADRKIIERLLPALQNRAPTRGYSGADLGDTPYVARVSDCAIALIQFHSLCVFYDNSSGGWFHTFDQWNQKKDRQKEVIEEVNAWWTACRDKSVTEGILAHLPQATSRAQAQMVKNLLELGRNGDNTAQKAAVQTMRGLLRGTNDERFEYANTLAKIGDFTALDIFYDELKIRSPMKVPNIIFLAKHGKQREWELLVNTYPHESVNIFVCPRSVEAAKVPYAIPILGVALNRTEVRVIQRFPEKETFSPAELATEFLQIQTGVDFGYSARAPEPQRAAAIKKAQQWWAAEGKAKYTLDYIEKEMMHR